MKLCYFTTADCLIFLVALIHYLAATTQAQPSLTLSPFTAGGDMKLSFNNSVTIAADTGMSSSGSAQATITTVGNDFIFSDFFGFRGSERDSTASVVVMLNGETILSKTYTVPANREIGDSFTSTVLANTTNTLDVQVSMTNSGCCGATLVFAGLGTDNFLFRETCLPRVGTLTLDPDTAAVSDTVSIKGMGWKTDNVTISPEYVVLLDGKLIARDFGAGHGICEVQPNFTITVPPGTTAGPHTITVVLVVNGSDPLIIKKLGSIVLNVIASSCPSRRFIVPSLQGTPKVESVVFEKPEGMFSGERNGPIDENPNIANDRTFGGGLRIFPDAELVGAASNQQIGPAKREVWVTIQTTAETATPVFIKSFDVDDASGLFPQRPDGRDNQGPIARTNDIVLAEGGFRTTKDNITDPPVTDLIITGQTFSVMTNNCGLARVKFIVTMQPGDNFRVVASMDKGMIDSLTVQGKDIFDPQNNKTIEEGFTQSASGSNAIMSQMLTVWRKLHVEVDSMPNPPDDPGSPSYAERNLIRGQVIGIDSRNNRLTLRPEPTSPAVILDDGSPNLSRPVQPNQPQLNNGRFENGSITIGNVEIRNLDGSGVDFVQRSAARGGIQLVGELFDVQRNRIGNFRILDIFRRPQGNGFNNGFTIEVPPALPGPPSRYEGGTFTVAGVSCTLVRARGNMIEVVGAPELPFTLRDDDEAMSPFLSRPPMNNQAMTAFEFMQSSDLPQQNLFAKAYVLPVYDINGNMKLPAFDRNIPEQDRDAQLVEVGMQLADGLDFAGNENYWVAYTQGGFQQDTRLDLDPIVEIQTRLTINGQQIGTTLGSTPTNSKGSLVFVEVMRDAASLIASFPANNLPPFLAQYSGHPDALQAILLSSNVVHEVGHQFGLDEDNAGISIMTQSVYTNPNVNTVSDFAFFSGLDLKLIRMRATLQTNTR